jgi:hypothetical protein
VPRATWNRGLFVVVNRPGIEEVEAAGLP